MNKKYLILTPLLLLLVSSALANQGSADSFGYMWTDTIAAPSIDFDWIDIKGQGSIFDPAFNDTVSDGIPLPFSFYFYGTPRNTIYISSNGWASFIDPGTESYPTNGPIPGTSGLDAMLAPFWDDLASTEGNNGGVYYKTEGSKPNRKFIIQWHILYGTPAEEIDFELILFEHSNLIKFQYKTVDPAYGGGSSASIGIKSTSSLGIQYTPSIAASSAILFHSSSLSGVSASISPSVVGVGEYVTFNYMINNINGPSNLGKLDQVTITNPFSSYPPVIDIIINGHQSSIRRSFDKPSEPGSAYWQYSGSNLIIQTSHFDVIDSIRIVFQQIIPDTIEDVYSYASSADAQLDISAAVSPSPQPSINLQPGALASITILDDSDGNGNIVNDRTINTDQSLTLYAAGYDAGNNYIGDQDVNWTITGNLDGNNSSGTSYFFNPYTARTAGSIIAKIDDKTASTGTINITYGNLADITINSSPGANGVEIGNITLTAGQSQALYAAGYDADGNFRQHEPVDWSSTGNLDDVDETAVTSFTFTPQAAPSSGYIRVTDGTFSDSTGFINVLADTLSKLIIRTQANDGGDPFNTTYSMTADTSVTLYAAGYDRIGNYLGDITVNWVTTGSLDDIDATESYYIFEPIKAPTQGTFIAKYGSILYETGTISVSLGARDHITINSTDGEYGQEFQGTTMTAGESIWLYAAEYDFDNNYRGPLSVTWYSTDPLNLVNASGSEYEFSPVMAPSQGTIIAYNGSFRDTTGIIFATPDQIDKLLIRNQPGGAGDSVGNITITADVILTLYAAGYDANDNYLGEFNAQWISTESLDPPVNETGSYISFNPVGAPASGIIFASYNGKSGHTGQITVNPGTLDDISINTAAGASGQPLGDTTLTAGQYLNLYAAGYDFDHNYIDEIDATWSTSGSLDPVEPLNYTGPSYTFTPVRAPSQGRIVIEYDDLIKPSGWVQVNSAELAYIRIRSAPNDGGIVIGDTTINTDETLTLYAAGYDENNYLRDYTVSWSQTGDLDVINETNDSLIFDPVSAHTSGTIRAIRAGLPPAETGTINIEVGALDHISINDEAGNPINTVPDLTTDDTLRLFCSGYDHDNNYISDVFANWSTTPTLDPFNHTGTNFNFSPYTARRRGTILATYDTMQDETDTITVTYGRLDHIRITNGLGGDEIFDERATAFKPLTLTVTGYDADDNYRTPVIPLSATWSTSGDLDSVNYTGSTFIFTPITANTSGNIIANIGDTFIDSTGTITVEPGDISYIKIRSAPNNAGFEVTDRTIDTDHSLELYAASYDLGGAYRGDVSATWFTTPNLDDTTATGTRFVFYPITAPTSGTIHASYGGLPDATVLITVVPGDPAQISDPNPLNGQRTTIAGWMQFIQARVTDQHGNPVSGEEVIFSPANSMSPAARVKTNTEGIAGAFFRSPEDQDSSTVTAEVSDLSPIFFTVYGIRYVRNSLDPNLAGIGQSTPFSIRVSNPGNMVVSLNTSQCNFYFTDGTHEYRSVLISPSSLPANTPEIPLNFQSALIDNNFRGDRYTPDIQLRGAGNDSSLYGNLTTNIGELTIGVEEIILGGITLSKDQVLLGEQNIVASVSVLNGGIARLVDPFDETTLIFTKHGETTHLTVPDLERIDVKTSLDNGDNLFQFRFDVPSTFPIDSIDVYFILSLNNSNVVKRHEWGKPGAKFRVVAPGNANYVAGSLKPNIIVPNQLVNFKAAFSNSGSAKIELYPNASYIEILNTGIPPQYLTGSIILDGDNNIDTVFFKPMTIPDDALPATRDVRWHLEGELITGQPFDTAGTIISGIQIINSAQVVFTNIDIPNETVYQGEDSVVIDYTLRNTGQSPAVITDLITHFTKDGQAYPDNYWIETDNSVEFPFRLEAGLDTKLSFTYRVLIDAPTDTLIPAPVVEYHDILTSSLKDTGTTVWANDTVVVIKPAFVYIQSMELWGAPNDPYININQTFTLRLNIKNDGEDAIERGEINIYRNSTDDPPIGYPIPIPEILPGHSEVIDFNYADSSDGSVYYIALIEYAINDNGDFVEIGQSPGGNIKNVTIQEPRHLDFEAVLADRYGNEVDSLIVSRGQTFTVRVKISDQGESTIEEGSGSLVLRIPEALFTWENPDDSVQILSGTPKIRDVEWRINATGISQPEQYDKFSFNFKDIPIDKNTGNAVSHTVLDDSSVYVTVEEAGAVTQNLIEITGPPGAIDGILSTEQEFNIHATISFNATIEQTGSYAWIHLPENYDVIGDTVLLDTVSSADGSYHHDWSIKAPQQAVDLKDIYVLAKGIDKNSGFQIQPDTSNILKVRTVKKAELSLNLFIEKWGGGAESDTLSRGQSFDLVAVIKNEGTADTYQEGQVALQGLEENPFIIYDSDRQDPPRPIQSFSGNDTLYWSLKVDTTQDIQGNQTARQELSSLLKVLRGETTASAITLVKTSSAATTNDIFKRIIQIANTLTSDTTDLKVKFTEIPLDENTNQTAFIPDTSKTKTLTIQEQATIDSVKTIAPDTVSTGQTFTYKVKSDLSENLIKPMAHLSLPDSRWHALPDTTLSLIGDSAIFNIRVPTTADYNGAPIEILTVLISGEDRNSGEIIFATYHYDTLLIQLKPELTLDFEIIRPISDPDKVILSYGQPLYIKIWPDTVEEFSPLAYADITDTGSVNLNHEILTDYGFEVIDIENKFAEIDQELVFKVRAPSRDVNASLRFAFNRLPRDKNSGDFVAVGDDLPLDIPIIVLQKEITVNMIDEAISNTTFTRGAERYALMAFNISNEGNNDSLKIDGFKVTFTAADDTTEKTGYLTPETVGNMIDSIFVFGYNPLPSDEEMQMYSKYQLQEYENPLEIDLKMDIAPDTSKSVMFLVHFGSKAVSRSFRVFLNTIFAYVPGSDTTVAVILENEPGLDATPFSVISGDMKEAFATYPNPFGRPPDEFAKVRFLLTETADVKLQIFTLVGDLVKSQWDRNLINLPRGLYDNYIRWDGRNDKGRRVLNGVYLCAIEIKSGSSTKRFVTKIAYIK